MPKFVQLDKKIISGKNILKFLVDDISSHRILQLKDIITVELTDISKINLGDFVFGRNASFQEGMFQVIKKRSEGKVEVLILRGEYNLYFDDKLYSQDLIGRVVLIQRNQHCIRFDTFIHTIKKNVEIGLLIFKRKLIEIIKFIQHSKIYRYFIKKIFSRSKFNYRLANIEDAPKIAKLFIRHYWPMPLKEIQKKIYGLLYELQGKGYCFVACKKDKIFGIIIAKEEYSRNNHSDFWYVDLLYVDFCYRCLGIGQQLILFVLHEGIKANIGEFRGASIKETYLYAQNIYKSLNLQKVCSFTIEKEIAPFDKQAFCGRLNYIFKITNPEALRELDIK